MRTFDLSKSHSAQTAFFNQKKPESFFGNSKQTDSFFKASQPQTLISDENPYTETMCDKCKEEEKSHSISTKTIETNTQVADSPSPLAPPTTGNICSPTSGRFTTIPSGNLVPTFNGGSFNAPFSMVGNFVTNVPCTCSCGEYRQFVRGFFKKNGTKVTHNLCSNPLEENTLHEDCGNFGGKEYKYGYRSNKFGTSYFDNPDQAGGCTFNGYDAPGLNGFSTGDTLEVNLSFVGFLVDTCNNGGVLDAASWTVKGTGTAP